MNPQARAWRWLRCSAVLVVFAACITQRSAAAERRVTIAPSAWRIVKSKSGRVNYYSVVREGQLDFVRARYRPAMKTAVLGWQAPDAERRSARKLRWSWRARTLPAGGDECTDGKGDSAAVVYVTWKRGLRYYVLKYVWSAVGVKGRICDRKRNPFVAQDTVILSSGPPLDTWQTVEVDLRSEFRKHFEEGDPTADVPDFVGLGIMTDGDQTETESAADYGTFTLLTEPHASRENN